MDKTLSKYRSEINSILSGSRIPATPKSQPNDVDSDVVYTKTVHHQNGLIDGSNESITQILYCPKPAVVTKPKTLIETIKERLTPKPTKSPKARSAFALLSQIRNGSKPQPVEVELDAANSTYLTPKKEIPSKLNHIFTQVSNIGLQLAKILPYIVFIIFTVIILQYVRMKFHADDVGPASTNKPATAMFNSDDDDEEHSFCSDVKDTRCSQTKLLARELIDYLRYVSGKVDCSPPQTVLVEQKPVTDDVSAEFLEKCVHLNKIIQYLVLDRGLIQPKSVQNVAVVSVLGAIMRNPHWDVRLLDENYKDTTVISQVSFTQHLINPFN